MKEKDLLMFITIVAAGWILVSLLAATLQWMIVIPVTVMAIISTILFAIQVKKEMQHLTVLFEKIAFFATLIFFIIAFIVLYRPP